MAPPFGTGRLPFECEPPPALRSCLPSTQGAIQERKETFINERKITMGGITVTRTAPAMSEKELRLWFREQLDEMAYEKGFDTYSGTWVTNHGLYIHPRAVASDAAAEDLCEKEFRKGGYVLAVRVGDFSRCFPETKADKALAEKAQELRRAVDLFDWTVLDRAQKAKSKTRKCPHCESSINVHKMDKPKLTECEEATHANVRIPSSFWSRGRMCVLIWRNLTDCPVCGQNLLLTDTDKKTLASLVTRRDEAQRKLTVAKAAYEAKEKKEGVRAHWYVSALCRD